MNIELQFKLRSNPIYFKYLHENSYWYKILNRNPDKFNEFVEEVKTKYHLRQKKKKKKAIDTVDMLSNVLSAFK